MTSKEKIEPYIQLSKPRLTLLVVITACLGYLIAVYKSSHIGDGFSFIQLLALALGGFFLTASSNTLNQIFERDSDKLMNRTNKRPLVVGSIQVMDALIYALITGILSLLILGVFLNLTAAFLGFFSLVTYAFFYTPMKKISPIAVFIGAFPGALPPLIGYVGYTGNIDILGVFIFTLQFFWQFPHFWSLAWVLHEDYQKASYFLLPSKRGKTKNSAFQILWYSIVLTLISIIPFAIGFSGILYLILAIISGGLLVYYSFILYQTLLDKDAKKVMFASFGYILIVLAGLLI